MMTLVLIVLIVLAAAITYLRKGDSDALDRLQNLGESTLSEQAHEPINWTETEKAISLLSDRLGKAGYFTSKERRRAKAMIFALFSLSLLACVALAAKNGSLSRLVIGVIAGSYLGFMSCAYFLRYKTNEFRREVTFHIPLLLESIILLVESGYGIFPALEHSSTTCGSKNNPVQRLFFIVYQLSAHGLPFGEALEMVANAINIKVLRHVLMHLDISNSEGGELIPSLRSLSEHSHSEWKISVETRVKRLENFVVFPVFAAVLGLMLLIGSVPLIPVIDMKDSLRRGSLESHSASADSADPLSGRRL